jgi:hypothetical protein
MELMNLRSPLAWIALASVFAVAGSPVVGHAQTAQTCLDSQNRYAGTACRGIAKCWLKSLKRGVPVDSACLAARSADIGSRYAAVEATDNCLTEPAADTIKQIVQDAMADAATALMPYPGRCGGKKIGALGRECKQIFMCFADAAAHSELVDNDCIASAQAQVAENFTRYETRETCLTTGDATARSNDITTAVDNAYTYLRGVGTTTTSTTTTSLSTTTTTTLGNCPEDGSFTPCTSYRDNPLCTACVDSAATIATTICSGAASQACTDAINNASCGYAINSSTSCATTCCP